LVKNYRKSLSILILHFLLVNNWLLTCSEARLGQIRLLLNNVLRLLLNIRSSSNRLLFNNSTLPEYSLLGLSVDNLSWLSVDNLLRPNNFPNLPDWLDIFRDISDALETETAEQEEGQDDEDKANDENGGNETS